MKDPLAKGGTISCAMRITSVNWAISYAKVNIVPLIPASRWHLLSTNAKLHLLSQSSSQLKHYEVAVFHQTVVLHVMLLHRRRVSRVTWSEPGWVGGLKTRHMTSFKLVFFRVFPCVYVLIGYWCDNIRGSEQWKSSSMCVCVCIPDGGWINCRFFCRKRARLIFFCFVLHATVDVSRALISFFSVKVLGTWQALRNYMHVLACGWRFSLLFIMCSVLWDFPRLHESLAADVPLVAAVVVVVFSFFWLLVFQTR